MTVVSRYMIPVNRIIKAASSVFTFRLGDSFPSTVSSVAVVLVYVTHVIYMKSK